MCVCETKGIKKAWLVVEFLFYIACDKAHVSPDFR